MGLFGYKRPQYPYWVPEMDDVAFGTKIPPRRRYNEKMEMFKDIILRMFYSNFEWEGLEDHEAHEIEKRLIRNGTLGIVKTRLDVNNLTPDGVFIGAPSWDTSTEALMDFYGRPMTLDVVGMNGKVFSAKTQDDFIIGFDTCAYNITSRRIAPLETYIDSLAWELYDAYAAWKVAVETRKSGAVYQCGDEAIKKRVEKILQSVSENTPWTVFSGAINQAVEVVFSSHNHEIISSFHNNFMNVWGLVMDIIGVEHSTENKRERNTVTEVQLNRSLARYTGADRLAARERIAEFLTKAKGTTVTVKNRLAEELTEAQDGTQLEGNGLNETSNL